MRNVKAERTLAAQQSSVWAVLADYPNIGDWNDGIKNSYAIGDATPCTMTYDYEPKGGPLAFVLGPVMDGQMKKAFQGFMENLETAAQARD